MLKIKPPDYQFCPFCSKRLEKKKEEGKTRKHCSFCSWTYYPHVATAAGAIVFRDGKVLLVKRNRRPYKGTWMFPAGFLRYGETPEEGATREAKEETGLRVRLEKLVHVAQTKDDPRSPGHFVFFYLAKIISGRVKNRDEQENSAVGWFDLDDLPPIGWQGHREVIKKVREVLAQFGGSCLMLN